MVLAGPFLWPGRGQGCQEEAWWDQKWHRLLCGETAPVAPGGGWGKEGPGTGAGPAARSAGGKPTWRSGPSLARVLNPIAGPRRTPPPPQEEGEAGAGGRGGGTGLSPVRADPTRPCWWVQPLLSSKPPQSAPSPPGGGLRAPLPAGRGEGRLGCRLGSWRQPPTVNPLHRGKLPMRGGSVTIATTQQLLFRAVHTYTRAHTHLPHLPQSTAHHPQTHARPCTHTNHT